MMTNCEDWSWRRITADIPTLTSPLLGQTRNNGQFTHWIFHPHCLTASLPQSSGRMLWGGGRPGRTRLRSRLSSGLETSWSQPGVAKLTFCHLTGNKRNDLLSLSASSELTFYHQHGLLNMFSSVVVVVGVVVVDVTPSRQLSQYY